MFFKHALVVIMLAKDMVVSLLRQKQIFLLFTLDLIWLINMVEIQLALDI